MKRSKWVKRLIRAGLIIGGSGVLPLSACNGTLGRQFRTAAGTNLQDGVQSIVTGVIDGLFAIVQPDPLTTNSQP